MCDHRDCLSLQQQLDTLVSAVAEMRRLQRQVWAPTEHPDLAAVLAAEARVDRVIAAHVLTIPLPPSPDDWDLTLLFPPEVPPFPLPEVPQ